MFRGAINVLVRNCELVQVKETKTRRGKLKIILIEVKKKDMSITEVTECMALNRMTKKNECGQP